MSHLTNRNSRKIYRVYLLGFMVLAVIAALLVWIEDNHNSREDVPPRLGPEVSYRVVQRYPHDPGAYTQGLLFHCGMLYESTGLYGASSLRKVDLIKGTVLQEIELDKAYFGEGLTLLGDKLYQLTWKEKTGFIYNLEDFKLLGTFSYPTEGWALTTDGTNLILSDGSSTLTYLDPATFAPVKTVAVTLDEQPVERLNELEYIRDSIFANIYMTERIVRIDPQTGKVLSIIDMGGMMPAKNADIPGEVLNGIAYDTETGKLYVTGKHWAWLYEIQLIEKTGPTKTH